MKRVLLTAALFIAVMAFAARADIPQTLNYQGVLTDGSGVAVPDGDYVIEFNIYNIASGGTALWTETDTVSVIKGIFSAVLGRWTALNLAFDEPYWLGMAVEGEAELNPRVELTATAYSLNSQGVTGEENVFPSTGYVGIGTTSPNRLLTIEGNSDDQINLQVNGWEDQYSTINVAARSATGKPGYAYDRGGIKVHTFLEVNDHWVLRVAGGNALVVQPDGNVGLGFNYPNERLEVDGAVTLGSAAGAYEGTIQWTGTDFEGYDGSTWQSLTGGAGGNLPPGTTGQTLWHNGTDWAATSFLHNEGTGIGIGTTEPSSHLHIFENIDGAVGIEIENPNTAAYSTEFIAFTDENGQLAGIRLYDDDRALYGSQMAIFNNRPFGAIKLATGGVERIMLTEDGHFGIGVSNPNATLHVAGGDGDVDGGEGDLKIGTSTYRLKIGVDTDPGDGGAGTTSIRAQGGTGTLKLGGDSNDVVIIEPFGHVSIGSDVQTGQLELFRTGVTESVVMVHSNDLGGALVLKTETGDPYIDMQPDTEGEGGYFSVARDAGPTVGFFVNGNMDGTNDPYVGIWGSSQTVTFDMRMSGDSSVDLPADAVASTEILNETGAASDTELSISLGSAVTEVMAQRTITVPSSGYVLAIGTGVAILDHTNGTESRGYFGVSDDGTFPPNQHIWVGLDAGAPTGDYAYPVTAHGLFEVAAAGSYTYYFLGFEDIGRVEVEQMQFTLVFIPTAYGTVEPTTTAMASGATVPKVQGTSTGSAAERSESIAFNEARIERELAEMRAKIAELEKAVNNR